MQSKLFVTSDILAGDRSVGARLDGIGLESEVLVLSVSLFGRDWPGAAIAVSMLEEAAAAFDLEMSTAGYNVGFGRTRSVSRKNIANAVNRAVVRGDDVVSVLLCDQIKFTEKASEEIYVGGEIGKLGFRNGVRGGFSLNFSVLYKDLKTLHISKFLIRKLLDISNFEYGYVYLRDNLLLPSGYSIGLGSPIYGSVMMDMQSDEIRKWSLYTNSAFPQGKGAIFRDVFEINFLGHELMSCSLGLGTVESAILGGTLPGELDFLTGGAIWTVPVCEIEAARQTLWDSGLMLSNDPRVYRGC